MRPRNGLARLAGLYTMVEQMRSVELRMAAGAVDDIVRAQSMEAIVQQNEASRGRAALASGDRALWQVAEMARSSFEVRMERLNTLRSQRQMRLDNAAKEHHLSRVSMEQMNRMVERERECLACEEGRRMQAEADDRFASRRAWREIESRRTGA